MPQELRVIQCFSCLTFQVDIAKKSKKWTCKVCGEKQTLKQEFCRGSGKDCRLFAQKLNDKRKDIDDFKSDVATKIFNGKMNDSKEIIEEEPKPSSREQDIKISKWNSFIEDEEEDIFDLDVPFVTETSSSSSITNNLHSNPTHEENIFKHISSNRKRPRSSKTSQQPLPELINFHNKSKFKVKQTSFNKTDVSETILQSKAIDKTIKQKIPTKSSKWSNFVNENDEAEIE